MPAGLEMSGCRPLFTGVVQVRKSELDLLYRVFDTNRNGFLELGEVVRHQERLGGATLSHSNGQQEAHPLKYRYIWNSS